MIVEEVYDQSVMKIEHLEDKNPLFSVFITMLVLLPADKISSIVNSSLKFLIPTCIDDDHLQMRNERKETFYDHYGIR